MWMPLVPRVVEIRHRLVSALLLDKLRLLHCPSSVGILGGNRTSNAGGRGSDLDTHMSNPGHFAIVAAVA